jgi:chromosome segregation ATPase
MNLHRKYEAMTLLANNAPGYMPSKALVVGEISQALTEIADLQHEVEGLRQDNEELQKALATAEETIQDLQRQLKGVSDLWEEN